MIASMPKIKAQVKIKALLLDIMSLQSAWTETPAPACYACTGWDTYQAVLALNALLNTTQIYQ